MCSTNMPAITDLTSRLVNELSKFNKSLEMTDAVQPISHLGVSTASEYGEDNIVIPPSSLPGPDSTMSVELGASDDYDGNSEYSDMYDSEIDGLDIEEVIGDLIAAEGQREDQDAIQGGVHNQGSQDEVGELNEEEEPEGGDTDFIPEVSF